MLVIGVTGGIGTGKSEVSRLLQRMGATVINADQVGHQAYTPHSDAWQEVVNTFGEGILSANGEIDRKKLGAIVFSDPAELAKLNQIMHPRMAKMVAQQIEQCRDRGAPAAVVEAAVLFEAGWDALVNEVWVVDAPEETVIQRIKIRNGLTEAEIQKRIDAQLPAAERQARATVVIDNSHDVASLAAQVKFLWDSRVKGRTKQA